MDTYKQHFREVVKVEYAFVYFADQTESIVKATNNSSKFRGQSLYIGAANQTEVNALNLKRSETGDEHMVLLNRLLEYIYVTHKTNMLDQCINYIDSFFRYIQTNMKGYFEMNIKGTDWSYP